MLDWWYSLTMLEQVFACVAIAATLVLAIQSILLLFGLGFGGGDTDFSTDMDADIPDGDANVDLSGHDGLSLFTIRGLVAFFAIGGWTGLALLKHMDSVLAVVIAVLAGTAAMVGVALLFKYALRLQDKGNLEIKNTLGKTAQVYLTIPPNGKGYGKITILLQEQLVELNAATQSPTQIPTGSMVRVCDVADEQSVLVEPLVQQKEAGGGISKWIQS